MRQLSNNPKNILNSVKCPQCQSTNWYRKANKVFHCKKCAKEWWVEV